MLKKTIHISFLIFIISFSNILNAKINIVITVDDEIITNHDLNKEGNYLKILNPNLNSLNNERILELAKNSLINEIIKKKEITKLIDINSENPLLDNFLEDLYMRLNMNNENEFEIFLKEKKSFSLDEIKKKLKIELLWNELIHLKYYMSLNIDKEYITKKVESLRNKKTNDYLLSEILFTKKKDLSLENTINQIKLSINEIGFNNTANIYSISNSSKLGGKLDWINENSLSKKIAEELKLLKKGQITNVIKISNNYLILKIENIREKNIEIDEKKEIKKLILIETNKQLNRFSNIYFNKSKMNYLINEN